MLKWYTRIILVCCPCSKVRLCNFVDYRNFLSSLVFLLNHFYLSSNILISSSMYIYFLCERWPRLLTQFAKSVYFALHFLSFDSSDVSDYWNGSLLLSFVVPLSNSINLEPSSTKNKITKNGQSYYSPKHPESGFPGFLPVILSWVVYNVFPFLNLRSYCACAGRKLEKGTILISSLFVINRKNSE